MIGTRGMTVVEVSIVVAILLLIAAISVPALNQNRQKNQAARCAQNLDAIAEACKKYAADRDGYPSGLVDLVPVYLESVPACPAGGAYSLGTAEGVPPACSVPGHRF